MGGGHHWVTPSKHPDLLLDPAVEKWTHMKESTHAYYRFTPRTVGMALVMGVALPVGFFYVHKMCMNKFDPYEYGLKQMGRKDAQVWKSDGAKNVHAP